MIIYAIEFWLFLVVKLKLPWMVNQQQIVFTQKP